MIVAGAVRYTYETTVKFTHCLYYILAVIVNETNIIVIGSVKSAKMIIPKKKNAFYFRIKIYVSVIR